MTDREKVIEICKILELKEVDCQLPKFDEYVDTGKTIVLGKGSPNAVGRYLKFQFDEKENLLSHLVIG